MTKTIDWGYHTYPFKVKSFKFHDNKEVELELFSFLVYEEAIEFAKKLEADKVKIYDEDGKIIIEIDPDNVSPDYA